MRPGPISPGDKNNGWFQVKSATGFNEARAD